MFLPSVPDISLFDLCKEACAKSGTNQPMAVPVSRRLVDARIAVKALLDKSPPAHS